MADHCLVHDRTTFEQLRPALAEACRSRDLTCGRATSRPGHAGYHDAGDVARLAAGLASARPEAWAAGDLAGLTDLDAADRDEELAFAREWFAVLADLYQRAARAGRV